MSPCGTHSPRDAAQPPLTTRGSARSSFCRCPYSPGQPTDARGARSDSQPPPTATVRPHGLEYPPCVPWHAAPAPRVDQDVALAAIDSIGPVEPAYTAEAGRPDRLAIDDAGTRLRVAPDCCAEPLTQVPSKRHSREIVICRLPGRELVREQPPGAATPNDVEDGVQDLANRVQAGSTESLGCRQKRVQTSELAVRQVGQIGSPRGQTPAIVP